jgi:hypothetical protein
MNCLRFLSIGLVALSLLLQGCGGGSDDATTTVPGGQNLNAAEQADYQLYLRTDVAAYGCAIDANYRDCESFYNGLAYFDGKCPKGDSMACQYSQALQANYMTYRVIRRY